MQVLHITNKKFSLEELENILINCIPGYYTIVWHTSKDIYDIKLYWSGSYWKDLFDH